MEEEAINLAARQHEVNLQDWRYSETSRTLYRFFDLLNERFFDAKLATPLLSFKRQKRQCGHYVNGRNEIGALENINISADHLADPLAEVLETLAHEMIHSYQQNYGKPGKRNYHNKQCQTKMDEIGIPCTTRGESLGMKDPFVSFLREHGVEAEARLSLPVEVTKAAQSSRLRKWQCSCPTSVWATAEIHARCLVCETEFRLKPKSES